MSTPRYKAVTPILEANANASADEDTRKAPMVALPSHASNESGGDHRIAGQQFTAPLRRWPGGRSRRLRTQDVSLDGRGDPLDEVGAPRAGHRLQLEDIAAIGQTHDLRRHQPGARGSRLGVLA
jgi:hypothetical protein